MWRASEAPVRENQFLCGRFHEDRGALRFRGFGKLRDHGRGAALEEMPAVEGFLFRHDRADASDRHALVDDPVDGRARFGDKLTNHIGVRAVMIEFQEAVEGALNISLDLVFLLVARADPE